MFGLHGDSHVHIQSTYTILHIKSYLHISRFEHQDNYAINALVGAAATGWMPLYISAARTCHKMSPCVQRWLWRPKAINPSFTLKGRTLAFRSGQQPISVMLLYACIAVNMHTHIKMITTGNYLYGQQNTLLSTCPVHQALNLQLKEWRHKCV